MRKNIKYIRSTQKDIDDYTIYSGQIISKDYGKSYQKDNIKVIFDPDYGFRLNGDNFADTCDIKITKNITFFNKICGMFNFIFFTIFG